MLAILTLNETEYIYRICRIFVARFRIWGGLSNALGRPSLPKPPRGAGAETGLQYRCKKLEGHSVSSEITIYHLLLAICSNYVPSSHLFRLVYVAA